MTGQQVYWTVYPMESATKATLPSKTTATPPPPTTTTTTTTTTTQVTTKKCHHANFPFWQSAETNGWENLHVCRWTPSTKWKVGGRDLTHEPGGGFPVDGWRAVVGSEWEARSIFLMKEKSMRKISMWKRSIKWKEIKKKEKWFNNTDSFWKISFNVSEESLITF